MLRFGFFVLIFLMRGSLFGAEVRLRGGERIQGEVVQWATDGLWVVPRWNEGGMPVAMAWLEDVVWPAMELDEAVQGPVDVLFRNGDRVSGEWVSMADGVLVFTTSWGQTVRVQREAVAELRLFDPGDRVLWRGPAMDEGWVIQDPRGTGTRPRVDGGRIVFHAASGITARKDLPALPSRFVVEVELRPMASPFSYRINLFGEENNTRGPGNLNVQVSHQTLSISGEGRDRSETVAWQDRLPEGALTEQRFVFLVDLESETVEVDLNDERMLTVKLPASTALVGAVDRSFSFQAQAGNGQIELAGVRLREHSAPFAPRHAGSLRTELDRVYLRDGRRVEGRVKSSDDQSVRVLAGRDVQVLARHRVESVVFAGEDVGVPAGSVRIRTRDYRGRLTLDLLDSGRGAVRGSGFGWLEPVEIPLAHVSRLAVPEEGGEMRGRGPDEVHFLNGDWIWGGVLDVRGTRMRLRVEGLDVPMEIPLAYIGQIRRQGGAEGISRSADMRLEFGNGDRLSGRFLEMDDNEIVLETRWGQRVRSRRALVVRMEQIPSGTSLLWRGPGDLKDWHLQIHGPSAGPSAEEVSQEGGALVLPGIRGVLRGMPPLPDRFEILVKMRAESGPGDFTVEFLKQGAVNAPVGGIHFFTQGQRLVGRGMFSTARNVLYFQQDVRESLKTSRRDLRIFGDLGRQEMMVVFNEEVIGPFEIPEAGDMRGKPERLMRIMARSPFHRLWVEEIVFSAYPHAFPRAEEVGRAQGGEDRVLFSNGDVLDTQVLGGGETGLRMRVDGEVLEVPRGRVQSVRLGGMEERLPRRMARDTRFFDAGSGDRLTLALETFDGETFRGRGDAWLDDLHLPVSAFRVVFFNAHMRKRLDEQISWE